MQKVVPLNDLSRALSSQAAHIGSITRRVVDSGWLVHGPEHAAFEETLARYVGARYAIGVASGTDALEIAMRAVHKDGRRTVVTVANAGGYSTTAALSAGFKVSFCDIDASTHLMDPASLTEILNNDVFAVVVTHLYGRIADVAAIRDACAEGGVSVIEDCAQAIGAGSLSERAGSLADVATFSFYPTKNLGALGDGGAITTSNHQTAERLRSLRQYGWTDKYTISYSGGRNSRLDELQAAVLSYRLPMVDAWNEQRRAIINEYSRAASSAIRVLPAMADSHAAHLAVVETENAAALSRHLTVRGIQSAVHYPIPDHQQPAFAGRTGFGVSLPATESKMGKILSLPCFPELTSAEVNRVCAALADF